MFIYYVLLCFAFQNLKRAAFKESIDTSLEIIGSAFKTLFQKPLVPHVSENGHSKNMTGYSSCGSYAMSLEEYMLPAKKGHCFCDSTILNYLLFE